MHAPPTPSYHRGTHEILKGIRCPGISFTEVNWINDRVKTHCAISFDRGFLWGMLAGIVVIFAVLLAVKYIFGIHWTPVIIGA